jgi:hypothetical protein
LLKQIAQQSKENQEKLKHEFEILSPEPSSRIEDYHSLDREKSEPHLSETDPFEKFNSRKYKELLDPSIVDTLIKSRERFLAEREKT